MSENKKKIAYWMTPTMIAEIQSFVDEGFSSSKGEFVREAVEFYTLDIYSHSTEEMKRNAAKKIERTIGRNESIKEEDEETPDQASKKPEMAKFEPTKSKYRKPGTGCITKINDNLYEGRYSPRLPNGKRISKNIYAKTREECETLLAELIKEMKAEIQAEKERIKQEQSM